MVVVFGPVSPTYTLGAKCKFLYQTIFAPEKYQHFLWQVQFMQKSTKAFFRRWCRNKFPAMAHIVACIKIATFLELLKKRGK
ncbi:hypothetical protein [Desulfovibrio cuneatus]|uniref:hypothetical protein n=1 Tax=Desulfovibrio cuneatus TaxID=159728 RepID=UPI0012EB7F72|nr:hypothetical protein [Desulfovibrio cuneatus]